MSDFSGFRLLNVMVERWQTNLDTPFARDAAQALREYADRVDKSDSGNDSIEQFTASNGCVVSLIHGSFNTERPRRRWWQIR